MGRLCVLSCGIFFQFHPAHQHHKLTTPSQNAQCTKYIILKRAAIWQTDVISFTIMPARTNYTNSSHYRSEGFSFECFTKEDARRWVQELTKATHEMDPPKFGEKKKVHL